MDSNRPSGGFVNSPHPSGLARWMFRFPLLFYHAGLGRLLGRHFLLLTHTGRRTGKPRQTVLEVVRRDSATGAYIIASGWGERSDWVRNLSQDAHVVVQSGGEKFAAVACRMESRLAVLELKDYAARYPRAFKALAGRMLGRQFDDLDQAVQQAAQVVPLFALVPNGDCSPYQQP